MKISYVTVYDAKDLHQWSGLGYYLAKELEQQGAEMDYIGNLRARRSLPQLLKKIIYRLKGQQFFFEREPSIGRQYAQQIASRVKPGTDIIFAPGTIPIAFLESDKPKVFYGDACFAGMIGFYDSFSHMCGETIAHGNYIEQTALASADLVLYASDWAAATAIANYTVDPRKVRVVPFGANIESDRSLQKIKELVSLRSKKECRLVFIGVDWERKRGGLAVAVAQALNDRGLPTTLHVMGIEKIPLDPLPGFVINHGFISKSTREGRDTIDELMSTSHFFILPTKAECYGLVFCEACSYGLPPIATNVGGIPTIIKEDVNGKMFPLSEGAAGYADYILSVFNDRARYEQLAYSSFNEYEQRLNWTTAGTTIMNLLREL